MSFKWRVIKITLEFQDLQVSSFIYCIFSFNSNTYFSVSDIFEVGWCGRVRNLWCTTDARLSARLNARLKDEYHFLSEHSSFRGNINKVLSTVEACWLYGNEDKSKYHYIYLQQYHDRNVNYDVIPGSNKYSIIDVDVGQHRVSLSSAWFREC